jgi:hypothetical protein
MGTGRARIIPCVFALAIGAAVALSCSAGSGSSGRAESTRTDMPALTATRGVTPTAVVRSDPYPAGAVGYAISWPQCGGPYPDEPFDFGIVGVTDGQAFRRNPCFADEYRWAERGRYHPSIYMNVNYVASADVSLGPAQCAPVDASCHAYRYGWTAAQDAYEYASQFDAVAPVWWLDVQIVSEWTEDLTLNARSIRGAADFLRSKGIRVGISSTSYQWETVAGAAQHKLPVWDASATDAREAAAFCREGKDFGGGTTEQIAFVADGFETVLACGGQHVR